MAKASTESVTATAIYQHNLDEVSRALWALDLPLTLQHIAIPNQMLTDDAELVITSPDKLLLTMTDFRDQMLAAGADRFLRVCRRASYVPGRPNMITGWHDTFVLRDGVPVWPPYLNFMTLIRYDDGQWRGVRVEARAYNSETPILSPDLAEAQRLDLQRQFRAARITRNRKEES